MSVTKRKKLDTAALGASSSVKTFDAQSLEKAAGDTHNPVEVMEAQRQGKAKSRIGKKQIQGYFAPDYRKKIKLLSAASDRSIEDLLEEAMNDLFDKYKDVLA